MIDRFHQNQNDWSIQQEVYQLYGTYSHFQITGSREQVNWYNILVTLTSPQLNIMLHTVSFISY